MSRDSSREEWGALCAHHKRMSGDANWFALRPDFDDLTAATRAGKDTLGGWRALEAKLGRLVDAELNQVVRHGANEDARAHRTDTSQARHGCPREICDRVLWGTPDAPPECLLFGVAMHELP